MLYFTIAMEKKRTYDQGCAAAHALDLIGERWALLVVRELMLGPKRFADLRSGLPGISPNVLSQRLQGLTAIGVARQRTLPPPAASQVYELTPWGEALEPVLMALGRWGVQAANMPFTAPTSSASLLMAFRTMFDPAKAGDMTGTIGLELGPEAFSLQLQAGELSTRYGAAENPDATITSDTELLKAVAFGGMPLEAAVATRGLLLRGDAALSKTFLRSFTLPEPLGDSATRAEP